MDHEDIILEHFKYIEGIFHPSEIAVNFEVLKYAGKFYGIETLDQGEKTTIVVYELKLLDSNTKVKDLK